MKAYLIDAAKREVREVEYEMNGPNTLHNHIGGYIETAWSSESGDILFVDEEGLLKPSEHFFRWAPRADYPFAGNGIVVGAERYDGEGNYLGTDPPTITIEQVRRAVQFITRKQADAWAKGNASEPAVAIWSDGMEAPEVITTVGQLYAEMPKPPEGQFSVWIFMPDDSHMPVLRFTDARTAVETAKQASDAKIGLASRAERIIITDGGDFTVFEWKRGVGVTFPKKPEVQS